MGKSRFWDPRETHTPYITKDKRPHLQKRGRRLEGLIIFLGHKRDVSIVFFCVEFTSNFIRQFYRVDFEIQEKVDFEILGPSLEDPYNVNTIGKTRIIELRSMLHQCPLVVGTLKNCKNLKTWELVTNIKLYYITSSIVSTAHGNGH